MAKAEIFAPADAEKLTSFLTIAAPVPPTNQPCLYCTAELRKSRGSFRTAMASRVSFWHIESIAPAADSVTMRAIARRASISHALVPSKCFVIAADFLTRLSQAR